MPEFKINHIDKIEGHAGFVGKIIDGQMDEAKMELQMGVRLFERMVMNRPYEDVPVIVARVCGVCPVVHHLTAIKALENALDVTPSEQTIKLRKLMMYGQFIQSHSLHVYFLCLSDFFNIKHDVELIKKFPRFTEMALEIRDFGNELIRIIGGRTIHPVSSIVGGFLKLPDRAELKKLQDKYKSTLQACAKLGELFGELEYPEFERETEYVALSDKNEYGLYQGNIISNKGLNVEPDGYEAEIKEIHRPYEVVKRVMRNQKSIFAGALSRINLSHDQLSPLAKKLWDAAGIKTPCYNSFYNVLAQVVEIVHCLEESDRLLGEILSSEYGPDRVEFKFKNGKGAACIEAPRGTLYHWYQLSDKGVVEESNIITPTAQFITNLEEDVKAYFPATKKMDKAERERKIKMLIRAYDPCITCTVH
ncbi:MAG: Ni/Fe hydrogenase subunit alpha [Parcubacteria group bacterium]|nr:Ni/Fe hydrogenase subunit alpha [Parcubacteria group bacterium]